MSRMCNNRTFLDNDVAFNVCSDAQRNPSSPQDIAARDELAKILIPYQVKITKAKEGVKDKSRFMLFCTENLRIYDTIDQYIQDRKQLRLNTKQLEQHIVEMNQVQLATNDELSFLNSSEF
jgi:hypothetical protein